MAKGLVDPVHLTEGHLSIKEPQNYVAVQVLSFESHKIYNPALDNFSHFLCQEHSGMLSCIEKGLAQLILITT